MAKPSCCGPCGRSREQTVHPGVPDQEDQPTIANGRTEDNPQALKRAANPFGSTWSPFPIQAEREALIADLIRMINEVDCLQSGLSELEEDPFLRGLKARLSLRSIRIPLLQQLASLIQRLDPTPPPSVNKWELVPFDVKIDWFKGLGTSYERLS